MFMLWAFLLRVADLVVGDRYGGDCDGDGDGDGEGDCDCDAAGLDRVGGLERCLLLVGVGESCNE